MSQNISPEKFSENKDLKNVISAKKFVQTDGFELLNPLDEENAKTPTKIVEKVNITMTHLSKKSE